MSQIAVYREGGRQLVSPASQPASQPAQERGRGFMYQLGQRFSVQRSAAQRSAAGGMARFAHSHLESHHECQSHHPHSPSLILALSVSPSAVMPLLLASKYLSSSAIPTIINLLSLSLCALLHIQFSYPWPGHHHYLRISIQVSAQAALPARPWPPPPPARNSQLSPPAAR